MRKYLEPYANLDWFSQIIIISDCALTAHMATATYRSAAKDEYHI